MFHRAWVPAVAGVCLFVSATVVNAAITDQAIFVAKSGNDANPGTKASPKLTIGAAVAAAQVGAIPNVVVSKGTYTEAITLPSGVSLFGGYDAGAGWTRSQGNTTTIQSAGTVLTINNYASTGQVEGFTINATAGGAPGASSIGILLNNASGIRISRNAVTTANGVAGANGANGVANAQAQAAQAIRP